METNSALTYVILLTGLRADGQFSSFKCEIPPSCPSPRACTTVRFIRIVHFYDDLEGGMGEGGGGALSAPPTCTDGHVHRDASFVDGIRVRRDGGTSPRRSCLVFTMRGCSQAGS